MSKEISLSLHLAMADHGMYPFLGVTQELDGSGAKRCNDQTIGTSAEAIELGDVASPAGLILLVNRDTTNFIALALDSGITKVFAKLKPGEFACWSPAASGTIYAKAYGGACVCTVFAFSTVAANAYSMHSSGQVADALNAAYALSAVISEDTIASSGSISSATIAVADYGDVVGLSMLSFDAAAEVAIGEEESYVLAVLIDGDPVNLSLDDGGSDLFATLPSVGSAVLIPKDAFTTIYAIPNPNASTIAVLRVTRTALT